MGRWIALTAVVCLSAVLGAQGTRRTIWDGVFTEAQAARGQQQYADNCARCHSDDLLGHQDAPALVGGPFMGRFDGSTADDIVQTIRRTMPQEAPNSLTTEAYIDLLTFILKANGSPTGSGELPVDRAALKQVFVTAKEAR